MLLAVDIGNTNITLGLFAGQELRATWRLATDPDRMPDEYGIILSGLLAHGGWSPADVRDGVISSVVPPLVPTFLEVFRRYFGGIRPLVLEAGVKTGVKILYENPREVGADRVANAAAAFKLFGGPTVVIDFGTGTTFDVVSARGEYLGGVIAPGIGIAAEALFRRTAKLPQVEVARPRSAIGRNTVAAIQAGLYFGYVGLVNEILHRIIQELGERPRVVATGGLAELIAPDIPAIERVVPDITLQGLRIIYELNRQKEASC